MASRQWESATTEEKLEMLWEDFKQLSDAHHRLAWSYTEKVKTLEARLSALEERNPTT